MTIEKPTKAVELKPQTARVKGARLAREWLPEPGWHREHGWTDAEAAEVLEEFRDYWCALSGARAVKLDWQATWRNWLRKTARDRRRGPQQWHDTVATSSPRVQQALTLADKLEAADRVAAVSTLW